MRHFYLSTNWDKPHAKEITELISGHLSRSGCTCVISDQKRDAGYSRKKEIPKETECVITLGGDGTLIQAARDVAGMGVGLIGINLGTLGYLTQISWQDNLIEMLDDLRQGQYQLERRIMLSGAVCHQDQQHGCNLALNEIVITRTELLKVLKFRVYVNEEYFNEYTADGMLIATPTGSTAYNLSAGGPIAEPSAKMIIMTPICPHSLNTRSIVLDAESVIRIEILGNDSRGQVAVFDGDAVEQLVVGDMIEIKKHHIDTIMVKLKQVSFYDTLRNKMAGI